MRENRAWMSKKLLLEIKTNETTTSLGSSPAEHLSEEQRAVGSIPTRDTYYMLNKAEKAEITDLYDGSFASVRELAMLFNVHINTIMYFVDYRGRRKKQAEATRRWCIKNPEKAKEINDRSGKKYRSTLKGKTTLRKKYLKKKREGFYQTEKYKTAMHEYYLKNKEDIEEKGRRRYLKRKKEGYFSTKEFKEKIHRNYLKRKNARL